MKIGIIGTGNMGTILTEAFIEAGAIGAENIIITNRTIEKAKNLQKRYEKIKVVNSAASVVNEANLIFICLKPLEIFPLLKDINDLINKDHCLVSITSPITVSEIESVVTCSVARVIPSITNRALSGVSLLSFGDSCSEEWRENLKILLGSISKPIEINENVTRVSSDLASIGPALYSYLTRRLINAAISETEIDEQLAKTLVSEMLIGLGQLLKDEHYTLQSLQDKVCVKGGITGEAIKLMDEQLGDLFEDVLRTTEAKFKDDKQLIKEQLS